MDQEAAIFKVAITSSAINIMVTASLLAINTSSVVIAASSSVVIAASSLVAIAASSQAVITSLAVVDSPFVVRALAAIDSPFAVMASFAEFIKGIIAQAITSLVIATETFITIDQAQM